jgi:hypothetical protein
MHECFGNFPERLARAVDCYGAYLFYQVSFQGVFEFTPGQVAMERADTPVRLTVQADRQGMIFGFHLHMRYGSAPAPQFLPQLLHVNCAHAQELHGQAGSHGRMRVMAALVQDIDRIPDGPQAETLHARPEDTLHFQARGPLIVMAD